MPITDTIICTRYAQVLYTIPTGSNPAGCTMSAERRRETYDICRRHNVLILEDDPYYFLQVCGSMGA